MHPKLSKNLFREYDIRGIVPALLNDQSAELIAHAFGLVVAEKLNKRSPRISVGWDGRLSSPKLKEAIIRGLKKAGTEALEVGLGPTPLTYFSVFHEDTDGCIMITGSHNPPDYNGLKMMIGKLPFYGEQIQALHQKIQHETLPESLGSQRILTNIKQDYLQTLLSAVDMDGKSLKVVWDAGNGASGEVVQALVKQLSGEHIVLFGEIDGQFPNHHPDPSDPHNLIDLQRIVAEQKADIGIAFDGDGDRIGVIDALGRVLAGDQILALLARDVLKSHQGATVIADVKTSQTVFDAIKNAGGVPLMWKTGHSNIKSKMQETGAVLAGEMSGHMFFADCYFGFDDAIYAAIRLLNILSNSKQSLVEMVDAMPTLYSTPEIRIDCDDDKKFEIIKQLVLMLKNEHADYSDIDGVRVTTQDGWWLIRASNTQPILVARAESHSPEGLERLTAEINRRLGAF